MLMVLFSWMVSAARARARSDLCLMVGMPTVFTAVISARLFAGRATSDTSTRSRSASSFAPSAAFADLRIE